MRVVRVQASAFELLKIHIHETSITCIYMYIPFTFFTGSLYFHLMFELNNSLTTRTPPSFESRVYSIIVVVKSIGIYTNQLNLKINNNKHKNTIF